VKARREAEGIRFGPCFCAALLALAVSIGACHAPQRMTLTLSVAASVKDAILEAEAAYLRDHAGIDFRNNFGSSGLWRARSRRARLWTRLSPLRPNPWTIWKRMA